jgi:adenine/guanine phosphoribosyltransferase-like PRPP-binding protein
MPQDAMVMLALLIATGFGALWVASLERGKDEKARLYGFAMAYSYFTAAVTIFATVSTMGFVLLCVLAIVFAIAVVVVRKRYFGGD